MIAAVATAAALGLVVFFDLLDWEQGLGSPPDLRAHRPR
jgi:hypothetical protein